MFLNFFLLKVRENNLILAYSVASIHLFVDEVLEMKMHPSAGRFI
jgi:hypothetical protein